MSDILIILTSHSELGNTGEQTGFHWSEMTVPYYKFIDAGHDVQIASVKGGNPPFDPSSLDDDESKRDATVNRFLADQAAMKKLENSLAPNNINVLHFDAVYFPGGHGTMWDLPVNKHLGDIVSKFYIENKIIAAVCHGPAIFANPNALKENGEPIVKGKNINCFTNSEECEVEKDSIVPFMMETKLEELGAKIHKGKNWEGFVIQDGNLITGQNPFACEKLAEKVISAVNQKTEKAA